MRGAFVVTALLVSTRAIAQQSDRGRFELAAGVGWTGPMDLARVDASETTSGNGSRALFRSATELQRSLGWQALVGVRVTPAIAVEGRLWRGRTTLATAISMDAEGARPVVLTEPIDEYLVEAGLVARLARPRGRRFTPYLAGGAGYLRHLHDGRTLVQTGRTYYAGGGLYVPLARGIGRVRMTGIRADVRVLLRQHGAALDDSLHAAPAASASLFVRF